MHQQNSVRGRSARGWVCACVVAGAIFLAGYCPRGTAQGLVGARRPRTENRSEKKTFWLLSSAVYGASLADMHQWISIRNLGNVEADPLAKPFARLPAPAYYAGGIALATGINLLSYKMSKSARWRRYRRIPQLVSIGGNTFGYVSSYYASNH